MHDSELLNIFDPLDNDRGVILHRKEAHISTIFIVTFGVKIATNRRQMDLSLILCQVALVFGRKSLVRR